MGKEPINFIGVDYNLERRLAEEKAILPPRMTTTSVMDMRISPPAARRAVPRSSAITMSRCSIMRTTSSSGGSMNSGAPSIALSYASLPVKRKAP